VTRERYDALEAAGLVWCGPAGDNVPRRKVFRADAQGLVPSTWWTHAEAGHNAQASAEQRRLFPGARPFSTPKPERLMARIIGIATDPGDLVIDPFLGSATTAAVAHKLGRRWIGIEASAPTIAAYAEPRLRAVVSGADRGGISEAVGWEGGGGFVTSRSWEAAAACPAA
jgi:adenine-specific DNA-methyltransferase